MSRNCTDLRSPMKVAAAAALAAGIGVAGTPAHAVDSLNALSVNALTVNALTVNALTANGSTLEDLNGVAVEAVTLPDEVGAGPMAERGARDPRRPLRAAPP